MTKLGAGPRCRGLGKWAAIWAKLVGFSHPCFRKRLKPNQTRKQRRPQSNAAGQDEVSSEASEIVVLSVLMFLIKPRNEPLRIYPDSGPVVEQARFYKLASVSLRSSEIRKKFSRTAGSTPDSGYSPASACSRACLLQNGALRGHAKFDVLRTCLPQGASANWKNGQHTRPP
jgi:hypothetical protein